MTSRTVCDIVILFSGHGTLGGDNMSMLINTYPQKYMGTVNWLPAITKLLSSSHTSVPVKLGVFNHFLIKAALRFEATLQTGLSDNRFPELP